MSRITVDKLIPTAGAVPEEGYDPVSFAGFTLWETGDEARFSLVVPDTYIPGKDFTLSILESSPSAALNHQWQVGTLLIRPGVHVVGEQTVSEACSSEFRSPAVADRLTRRSITVTGASSPGTVNGLAIQPGDFLSWTLTRVASSQAEDPEPIKVLELSLDVSMGRSSASGYPGRVGHIIDTVRDLFNEAGGGFVSDDFMLRAMNRCLQDLAQDDYWRTETWIPCQPGAYRVDLFAAIPSFQSVHQVRHDLAQAPMTCLGSYVEFDSVRSSCAASGIPEYYVVQNTDLLVWPPPSGASEAGLYVYHSYVPTELTGSDENPNPPIPRAHDMVFVYFVLRQAFLRDRHAPGADAKFQEYSLLYDRAKQALLSQGEPPVLSLRPHR